MNKKELQANHQSSFIGELLSYNNFSYSPRRSCILQNYMVKVVNEAALCP